MGIGKGIGRRFDRFDPNAEDGDGDGIVQDGTAFQRPAVPLSGALSKKKKRKRQVLSFQANRSAAKPPKVASAGGSPPNRPNIRDQIRDAHSDLKNRVVSKSEFIDRLSEIIDSNQDMGGTAKFQMREIAAEYESDRINSQEAVDKMLKVLDERLPEDETMVGRMKRLLEQEWGFTLTAPDGKRVTTGISVAMPGHGHSFKESLLNENNAEDLVTGEIEKWLDEESEVFENGATHFGGWVNDEGRVVLDPSEVLERGDVGEAAARGFARDQEGIYDIDAAERARELGLEEGSTYGIANIPTGGVDGDQSKRPIPEADRIKGNPNLVERDKNGRIRIHPEDHIDEWSEELNELLKAPEQNRDLERIAELRDKINYLRHVNLDELYDEFGALLAKIRTGNASSMEIAEAWTLRNAIFMRGLSPYVRVAENLGEPQRELHEALVDARIKDLLKKSKGFRASSIMNSLHRHVESYNIAARQLLPQNVKTSLSLVLIKDNPGIASVNEATPQYVKVKSAFYRQPKGSLAAVRDRLFNGDPELIDVKAFALAAMCDEVKSGLVGFRSRSGRTLNAAASYLIPGDTSILRKPGRSLAMSAVTPGGGGIGPRVPGGGGGGLGGRIGRTAAEAAVRCPTGYQFGGRFSNRQLRNCGQQLFDTPGNVNQPGGRVTAAALRVARTLVNPPGGAGKNPIVGVGRIGPGERSVLDATISRMAQVPRVGAANESEASGAIASGIQAVAAAATNGNFSRLIRRDGVALDSRVSIAKLASQRNNPDLADGTIISAITSPSKIGADEVNLFSAGISSLRLVAPGGQEIRLDRAGKISRNDAQQLSRQWTAIRRGLNNAENTIGLQQLAARSNNKLRYSEKFNNIDRPNELVTIERNGVSKTVPRWVYESFYSANAPGRKSDDGAWKITGVAAGQGDGKSSPDVINDVEKAVAALDANSDLADIPTALRDDAIKKAKSFTSQDIGNGNKLLIRKNGDRFVQSELPASEAFGQKLTADLQKAIGLDVPEVLLGKQGAKRSVYRALPDSAVAEGKINATASLEKASPADLAQIALSDFLLGRTGRSAGSIALVSKGNAVVPVANGGDSSELLSGGKLTNNGLVAAISRKPQELLASLTDGGGWVRDYTKDPSTTVRRLIIENYDNMLERISKFDWAGYLARIDADGEMTIADKQHIEFMRRLLSRRAGQLRSSRKTVLRILGVSE